MKERQRQRIRTDRIRREGPTYPPFATGEIVSKAIALTVASLIAVPTCVGAITLIASHVGRDRVLVISFLLLLSLALFAILGDPNDE